MKHFLIPNWLNDIYWSLFSDPDVAFGLLINLAVTWYPLVTGLVVGVGGKRSGPNMKRVEKNSCVIPNPWELISISCWFEKRSLPIWRFSQQQQSSHIKDSLFWTQGLCLPIFFLFFSLIFFSICIRTSMKTEEASTSRKATKLQEEKVPVENPSGFTHV